MNKFIIAFTKITAYPVWYVCCRPKIHYEDRKVQSTKIKGPAIIISNHTSIVDFALLLFAFFGRTIRGQMAEVLFKKKLLGWYLRKMGGIEVNRVTYNFSFIEKSIDILNEGGVLAVFPESRIPRKDEERPLKFKASAAYIAMKTNVPIIPVYTNGKYLKKERARLIVGTPIYVNDYFDSNLSEKKNIRNMINIVRNKILELRDELERQTTKK